MNSDGTITDVLRVQDPPVAGQPAPTRTDSVTLRSRRMGDTLLIDRVGVNFTRTDTAFVIEQNFLIVRGVLQLPHIIGDPTPVQHSAQYVRQ